MVTICPECGSEFIVGVEVWGVYDGTLYWWCESCQHRWPRFAEADWPRLHRAALTEIERERRRT